MMVIGPVTGVTGASSSRTGSGDGDSPSSANADLQTTIDDSTPAAEMNCFLVCVEGDENGDGDDDDEVLSLISLSIPKLELNLFVLSLV